MQLLNPHNLLLAALLAVGLPSLTNAEPALILGTSDPSTIDAAAPYHLLNKRGDNVGASPSSSSSSSSSLHPRTCSDGSKRRKKTPLSSQSARKQALNRHRKHAAAQKQKQQQAKEAQQGDGNDKKKKQHHHQDNNNNNNNNEKSSDQEGTDKIVETSKQHTTSNAGGGLLSQIGALSNKIFSGACPHANADATHPNGALSFLTCGLSRENVHSTWNPPHVELKDLQVISAEEAASKDIFRPCAQYKSNFERASQKTGVPAVLLMSFAVQESSCRPHIMGPNGEFGMMQITGDKCGGAPNGDCLQIDFNIERGAKYFRDQLDGECKGNVLCAAGTYNGWRPGTMSFQSATNQQWGCRAQNNLDYLNSLFNGFCQGKDGHAKEFRKFNNLEHCA